MVARLIFSVDGDKLGSLTFVNVEQKLKDYFFQII